MNSENKEILMEVLRQKYGSHAEMQFELMNKYYLEVLDECMMFLRKHLGERV